MRRVLQVVLLLPAFSSIAGAADPAFDPVTGYRIAQYRAPVPAHVPGGITIGLEELERLVREQHAILLDVLPSEGAGADPFTGVWQVPKPHGYMAGSVWLPDVGRGRLSPRLEAYFESNLARLTGGDKARVIIVYCQADCWMSWNAVKRAAGLGYSKLYWFPEGTDGMRDFDVPLVPADPVPVAPGGR